MAESKIENNLRAEEDEDEPNERSKLTTLASEEPGSPKIPDGGWGWMVVAASLVICLIQDGIAFSFGTLYTDLVEEFQASKSTTSWIGSLFLGVPLLTGPLMSALVDKYGCRSMTIVAGLTSAAGFVLSYFAKNVVVMYFTIGIMSGVGLGLTYVTAVVCIPLWFDKRRNLAVGLGACGIGIGTFVYAPFTTFLLEEFQWRWTVVLLGGTLLNMCVCGALMRDPDWLIKQNKENKKAKNKAISLSSLSPSSQKKTDLEAMKKLLRKGQDAECVLETLVTSNDKEDEGQKEHFKSVMNLPTFIKQKEAVPAEVLHHLKENKKLYNVVLQNYPGFVQGRGGSEKGLNKVQEENAAETFSSNLVAPQNSPPAMPQMDEEKSKKGDSRRSSMKQYQSTNNQHQKYFKNMSLHRHSIHRGSIFNSAYTYRASSCPAINRMPLTTSSRDDENATWYWKLIKPLFLFDELHFFLMSLSTIILFAWFMTPYFYLVDHMEAVGYDKEQASYVLSTIGVANTIGMVVLGWAGDQPWTNVMKTYGICLVLCGVFCSAIIVATDSYLLLHVCSALYGVSLASTFSFTPMVLMELLPMDAFTKAYGLTLLCQGVGHLAGPPIAAVLADITGTWTHSFHLSAFWIIISGVLILVIPYTTDRRMLGSGPVEKQKEKLAILKA